MAYEIGPAVAEGKTKILYEVRERPELVMVHSKDDITAGDGAKHDIIPHKGEWATTTTSNMFSLLERNFFATAFREQVSATRFVADRCEMIPLEVVVRREAHGSFCQRLPGIPKGTRFPEPVVEFYLKTTSRVYDGLELPWDDPLLRWLTPERFVLSDPHTPQDYGWVELTLKGLDRAFAIRKGIEEAAREAFVTIEEGWAFMGRTLVDIKFEYGFDADGNLRLADVVDNDSWRLMEGHIHLDKQCYRDGESLDVVAERYRKVALLTTAMLGFLQQPPAGGLP